MAATESVTILFTELAGSTEPGATSPLESADDVRKAHFASLRRLIAGCDGTEVKIVGDGVMVAFSASSRAVSCAVAMQQLVEAENRRAAHDLRLRIGLSSGEATHEADDYFGDPVVEAARLCARALDGQILAAQLVQAMAGRRSPHTFRPVGELELKGLREPLPTVEVEWEPSTEVGDEGANGSVPLPRRLLLQPMTGAVIGRRLQLDVLQEAFKRVSGQQGCEVVLVGGEPGQGKTTLAAEAARRAHGDGAIVLLGRSDDELGIPYRPFCEAIDHYVSHAADDVLVEHVASHGAELARLSKALRSRVEGLGKPQETDGETERYLLYAAASSLLASALESGPIVLVLDDLQWADAASLQLLRHLVQQSEALPLLVIGTYRDTELSPSHPLTETLAALNREPGVTRVKLRGLDDDEVVQYLEAAAGHDLADVGLQLAHTVYGETDGNPFYLSEMLRHLIETGAIGQDESGGWEVGDLSEMTLPNSVREVIATRVGRLPGQAARILSMAAVIGRDFDLESLSRIAQRDEDELLDLLDAAVSVALVREMPETPGRYSFSHALVQHTLYQELGATRRARTHRLVAEALEDLCGDHPERRASELAHHWSQATRLADSDKAIRYSRQAGQSALASLAPADAVRHFEQALHLLDHLTPADPSLALDLRLELGIAQRQAGLPAYRETLLDVAHRARASGDPARLVRAALANSRGFFSALGAIDAERVAVLEAALEAAPPGDSADRAVLLAALCCELAYSPTALERRLDLAREAMAMAQRVGDATTRIQTLALVDVAIQIPALNAQRVEETAEGLRMARQLGDPWQIFLLATVADKQAMQAAQFDGARRCLEDIRETNSRLHQPTMMWTAAYREASYALAEGEPDRAEEFADAALKLGTESGQPDAVSIYGTQLMMIRHQQGRMGELVSLAEHVVSTNPDMPAYRGALALAHFEAGDEAEARRIHETAAAGDFELPPDPVWIDGIMVHAWTAIRLGAADHAARLFQLLAPHREQIAFDGVVAFEPVATYLGALAWLVGRNGDAEDLFAEGLTLAQRGGMKYAQAQTQLLWGRMIASDPAACDRDRARSMLENAHDLALAHSYGAVERQSALLLGAG